jgi:hypothetical protein
LFLELGEDTEIAFGNLPEVTELKTPQPGIALAEIKKRISR